MSAAENDAEFDALVEELEEEFFALGDVTVRTGGTYDPTAGEVTGQTTTPHANVSHSPPLPVRTRYVDGDVVKVGDHVVWFRREGLPFTPELGQVLDLGDGVKWTVVEVRTPYSGETSPAYRVFLRR
ncbi:MAG: hypothetical protein GY716_15700 [bacterium]|nr:hypothetical protein [bacterium]